MTDKIKRFHAYVDGEKFCGMREWHNGEYVLYSDHIAAAPAPASKPEVLTPMLLLNAALCADSPELVATETRFKIAEKLRTAAHELQALTRLDTSKEASDPNPTPEQEAEHFIQEAIDRAPEPLRRLGEYLGRVLDEDQWKTAERMLLGIAANSSKEAGEAAFYWVVELRPAFGGHPAFPPTYYAGWMKSPLDAARTYDVHASPKFTSKEDAQRVADKLGHTLSCVWRAVEHGFHAAAHPAPTGQPEQICDCENPEPKSGPALVSMECPIHNENPRPAPTGEAAQPAPARDEWTTCHKCGAPFNRTASPEGHQCQESDDATALAAILHEVRQALQFANDCPNGGISDTLWMIHRSETMFDFIDAALEKYGRLLSAGAKTAEDAQ